MKNEITLETILVRNDSIPSANIDGEIGLMSIDKGKYYALNTVGSDIWNILDKPTSLKDLAFSLTSEYKIDMDTCMKQVKEFVEKLIDEGIVLIK
jgi:hypothetical protein